MGNNEIALASCKEKDTKKKKPKGKLNGIIVDGVVYRVKKVRQPSLDACERCDLKWHCDNGLLPINGRCVDFIGEDTIFEEDRNFVKKEN